MAVANRSIGLAWFPHQEWEPGIGLDREMCLALVGPSSVDTAEKEATLRSMKEIGCGTSRENQRLYRNLFSPK